ncbi:hypothetical protein NLI96_g3390 [Meripilus lineatus]|uniref:Uncharacterized protein n=1 Tax=Meripilus lineatus TaxID=2056292 RepID=A0AAD5V735_9APHY|nr:hypothetical protein NLI96_g3390 [Physisporinus lineatus]
MELQDVATHAERFDLSSVINSVRFLALKRAMVGNWLITPFEFSASKRKTRWSPGESSDEDNSSEDKQNAEPYLQTRSDP